MSKSREVLRSSPTNSAKPVGVWAASQRLIPTARTIWIIDAHRGDGKRFVAGADEELTAFIELEAAVRERQCFVSNAHHSASVV
jgi:hypothetical protein